MELRATKENPNHLSVGMVIIKKDKIAIIKRREWYILPAETIYSNESLESACKRGAQEELGADIVIKRYLGSITSKFLRDGEEIENSKTTLYFLCEYVGEIEDNNDEYEIEDEVLWVSFEEAREKLEGNELGEVKLLEKI